jgi:hypothetical protein
LVAVQDKQATFIELAGPVLISCGADQHLGLMI